MGVRNQQRRAAKKKARDRRQRQREEASAGLGYRTDPSGGGGGLFDRRDPEDRVDDLLRAAVHALLQGPPERAERQLDGLTVADRGLVDRVLAEAYQAVIAALWPAGWTPADLVRVVRRECGKRPAGFALEQISAQLRGYAAATVDDRWHAQLRELGAAVREEHDDHRLTSWAERQRLDRSAALRDAVRVLGVLTGLPEIGVITQLPGTARTAASRPGTAGDAIDERVLGRVRGLLAKAESTEFPEEAEALSAKAQELMARHSIDHALLAARPHGATARVDEPAAVRIGIDAPYEQAKALLLQEVSTANRCRSVWSADLGFATVLGFPADVESVELLYTSLLVQATAVMVRAGSQRGRGGQSTVRSFRQSFLQAYAVRIGERLRTATDGVSREAAAAEGADRLLPVLAAREDAVQEAVDAMFPEMVQRHVRGNNAAGWAAGTAAADLAALGARAEVANGAGRPR
jgi:hypothetical protein